MQNVKIGPFKIIGTSVRTNNKKGGAGQQIPELWNEFISENIADKIPNKVDGALYALYTDYESDHTGFYTTIIGCKVKNLDTIPEGMIGKSFDGGNYVQLSAKGDLTKGVVINKWLEIWEMDLERVYTVDYEVYGEKAQHPADAEVDFLIAVK
ncbi:GyrI-like domain-containing protein [Maribacter sp. 2304DJ31-5]|uniref:GyrI-like domain-containing protein n=1 Tax=Maribacter sp. 2304DJ31-5 TaxID=3386273 RepID=UPI0039BD7B8A